MKCKTGKILLALLLVLGTLLTGCGKQEVTEEPQADFQVFFVNKEQTRVGSIAYNAKGDKTDASAMVKELIQAMQKAPSAREGMYIPLDRNLVPNYFNIQGDQLTLDFGEKYGRQDTLPEVLVRAAIVRTMSQIDGINMVSFTISGRPLENVDGSPVGIMTAETFVDNDGLEISNYEKVKLHLYFANETGDGLIEIEREVVYNSNIALEKLVVEEIINGPNNEESQPTVNPATKVLGVTVKDGTCYVNLSQDFLTSPGNITRTDLPLYSIVNSLSELPNINKVQFSIDGDSSITYKDVVDFNTLLERNLDIVTS